MQIALKEARRFLDEDMMHRLPRFLSKTRSAIGLAALTGYLLLTDQTERRPAAERTPWQYGSAACGAAFAAAMFEEVRRSQHYFRKVRNGLIPKGIIGWIADHPKLSAIAGTGALFAYQASTKGFIGENAIRTHAEWAHFIGTGSLVAGNLAFLTELLRGHKPPRLSAYLDKAQTPDQFMDNIDEYSRATYFRVRSRKEIDPFFASTASFGLAKLAVTTVAKGYSAPENLEQLAEQFTNHAPAKAVAVARKYLTTHPDQQASVAYIAVSLLRSEGAIDAAKPLLEELLMTHLPEQIEDYDVYRIAIPEIKRMLILKRGERKLLEQEQESADRFFLDNADDFVQPAWSYGVVETSQGSFEIQTAVEAQPAADELYTRRDMLPSVFRAPAAIHTTLAHDGIYRPEKTLGKIAELDVGYAAQEAILRVLSRERPLVFDGDCQLLNIALQANTHVVLYELEPRGAIPPAADVARTVGLIPLNYGIAEINHAITNGYLAHAPRIARQQKPTEFIREVHLNVPIRALSFAAGMRKRVTQHKYVRTFLERGLASISSLQEGCQESLRPYLTTMQKEIRRFQGQFG